MYRPIQYFHFILPSVAPNSLANRALSIQRRYVFHWGRQLDDNNLCIRLTLCHPFFIQVVIWECISKCKANIVVYGACNDV